MKKNNFFDLPVNPPVSAAVAETVKVFPDENVVRPFLT